MLTESAYAFTIERGGPILGEHLLHPPVKRTRAAKLIFTYTRMPVYWKSMSEGNAHANADWPKWVRPRAAVRTRDARHGGSLLEGLVICRAPLSSFIQLAKSILVV